MLYNTVLVLPYIDMNQPRMYMSSQSWTLLPLTTPYHLSGSSCAPAPSILYPVLNTDWQFVSYMIVYVFQCHCPKLSHPLPLPQSPKVHSVHLVSLLLSRIQDYHYHLSILYWCFSFRLTSLCIIGSRCLEWTFGLCGRGRGWDDLGEWHWNMYTIM